MLSFWASDCEALVDAKEQFVVVLWLSDVVFVSWVIHFIVLDPLIAVQGSFGRIWRLVFRNTIELTHTEQPEASCFTVKFHLGEICCRFFPFDLRMPYPAFGFFPEETSSVWFDLNPSKLWPLPIIFEAFHNFIALAFYERIFGDDCSFKSVFYPGYPLTRVSGFWLNVQS